MLRQLFVLLVLALSAPAWGNGIYYPEKAVPAMPQIPLQRALITYRNGVETLVLESALTTPSRNVGWIVPLPAKPTRIDVADKDMLRMLAASQEPQIMHDLHEYFAKPQFILVAMVPLCLLLVLVRRPLTTHLGWTLFGVLCFAVVMMVVVPQFTSAGLDLSRDVSISSTHRIGPYEAQVLHAPDAQSLSAWLASQSLQPLTPQAMSIVDDYIRKGWCFVVTRLQLDTPDQTSPRPLLLSFPTTSCVFPMRLTQLAGSTTQVELHIASDQQAQATSLQCIVADNYTHYPATSDNSTPWFSANHIGLEIVNPDVVDMLWPNCTMTKLVGQLTPAQMNSDIAITFAPLQPYRQLVFTERGRRELWQISFLWGAILCIAMATIAFYGRRLPGRIRGYALLTASILTVGTTAGIERFVPVIPTKQTIRVFEPAVQSDLQAIMSYAALLREQGKLHAGTQLEELLPLFATVTNILSNHNPCTRQPYAVERTPGNISLRTVQGKTYFCIYDTHGRENRLELPPATNPQRR